MAVDYDNPRGSCRPCCSSPSGFNSTLAALFASVAIVMSFTTEFSCHYLGTSFDYCVPPPPPKNAYACCGDCYCINGDEPCPTRVPILNVSDRAIEKYKSMEVTNPFELPCNPYDTQYTGEPCDTIPPQEYTELGDAAICGILYNMSSLDDEQCPTQYSMKSYPDLPSAEAEGAVMTHWGACGACSTTQDLAVYLEHPDLTTLGVECSFAGILDSVEEGIRCYQRAGYTRSCSQMWIYNGFQTRDFCVDTCLSFRVDQRPSNGPPPVCLIDDCLQCDEDYSGPLFQKVAARSRRRAGLVSRIARPCENILFVDHQDPCDVVQGKRVNYTQGDVCEIKNPEYDPTPLCRTFTGDMGLTSYEAKEGEFFFDIDEILGLEDPRAENFKTQYGSCAPMNVRGAVEGFWVYFSDEWLGAPWRAASAFAVMSSVIGAILLVFTWTAQCVAFEKLFWQISAWLYGLCGIFDILTLVYFAADVCKDGCKFRWAAGTAIIAGVFFFAAAVCSWKTAKLDLAISYTPVPTNIAVTEYSKADGTEVIEKVTNRNGLDYVETTTVVKKQMDDKPSDADETTKKGGTDDEAGDEKPSDSDTPKDGTDEA